MSTLVDHPALTDFFTQTHNTPLADYHSDIQSGLTSRFNEYQHGFIHQWSEMIRALPRLDINELDLVNGVRIRTAPSLTTSQSEQLKSQLMQLHPWRKGPYQIDNITIDCEWRSDWKWQRISPYLQLSGKTVLDIGCGNGYHAWRMLGAGANLVIGIDPSQLFWYQFLAIKRFIGHLPIHFLPIGIQHLPKSMPLFDSVFSMGVFYHRKSPIDHLSAIRDLLKPNGEMIIETLVIDGDEQTILTPSDRYACMPNVWFIPSIAALSLWIEKAGFSSIRCLDVTRTSTDEQRTTDWMTYQSLKDFLDPNDETKTKEGYPAPTRAVILATK